MTKIIECEVCGKKVKYDRLRKKDMYYHRIEICAITDPTSQNLTYNWKLCFYICADCHKTLENNLFTMQGRDYTKVMVKVRNALISKIREIQYREKVQCKTCGWFDDGFCGELARPLTEDDIKKVKERGCVDWWDKDDPDGGWAK